MLDKRSELELKLLVGPDFQLPPLASEDTGVADAAEKEPLQLSATYFDTPDLRLLRHGITLRYRTGEDDGPLWTLKLPANGHDKVLRNELEYSGDPGQPPQEIRDTLFGVMNGSSLCPVAEIKTRRRRWALRGQDGAELAELVDDRVSVLDGNEIKDSFREIEVEAKNISRESLEHIAERIHAAGAQPEQRSKASRALEAIRGSVPGDGHQPLPGPGDPAGDALAPALRSALERLLIYDPYARLGEAEGVHQLRVAGRRLRSVLRTFSPLLDQPKMNAAHDDLRWLGQALGAVRDLDVLTEGLRGKAGDASGIVEPLLRSLQARHDSAQIVLREALCSERYAGLVQRLTNLANDPEFVIDRGESCEKTLPELAWRMWRKLADTATKLQPFSPEAEFHRSRILAKRARYAAEEVVVFLPKKVGKRLSGFAIGAESVQNVLGEHLDATFARELLMEIAPEHRDNGPLTFELGRLVERYDQVAREKRGEFFKQWRKLDRKRNLEWANR